MLAYAWNSAPVSGTDLNRSLLVTGREFNFPIDFESQFHVTYNISEEAVRTFADDTLILLRRYQEMYKLLIAEHRALRREHRNSQLRQRKKFKVGDIVFTKVQVQCSKSKGRVAKLLYLKRGPNRTIETLKSGSYKLVLNDGHSRAIIKKTRIRDLPMSPRTCSIQVT